MSKLRSINTAIWSDVWFEGLNTNHKLLFIYLITNEKTNMLGVYEVSLNKISFETGINKLEIESALKFFEKSGKIKYSMNRIILYNYMKHQSFNFNMKKSAIDNYNDLPNELKIKELPLILERTDKAFETLCKGFGILRKVEVELEIELEVECECELEKEKNTHTLDLPKNKIENKTNLKINNDIRQDAFIINRARYEEILTLTGNEKYAKMIRFILGENEFKKPYRQLISLEILTEREHELLFKRLVALDKDMEYLTVTLRKMDDYANIKQTSLYGVFNSWLSNEKAKTF